MLLLNHRFLRKVDGIHKVLLFVDILLGYWSRPSIGWECMTTDLSILDGLGLGNLNKVRLGLFEMRVFVVRNWNKICILMGLIKIYLLLRMKGSIHLGFLLNLGKFRRFDGDQTLNRVTWGKIVECCLESTIFFFSVWKTSKLTAIRFTPSLLHNRIQAPTFLDRFGLNIRCISNIRDFWSILGILNRRTLNWLHLLNKLALMIHNILLMNIVFYDIPLLNLHWLRNWNNRLVRKTSIWFYV